MMRSCSTSLESICKRIAVATHRFYMLRILQTATPTHRQYEALGLLFPGCCTYLEPASRETAVIPNLTQLIWPSISIRKYYQGVGGRGSCSVVHNGGLNGEDFIKLQGKLQ